jgi:hypothetical protein
MLSRQLLWSKEGREK